MDFFSDALSRLKYVLHVSKDGEVAEALGFSKTAFSERKKRGSFPTDELRALAQRRPDLGIDVDYVLTGEPPPDDGGDETDDAFADRIQAESRMRRLVEALPLDDQRRMRLAALMTGAPAQDAPQIAEAIRDAMLDKGEQLLLDNYRRCSDEARAYLVQECALLAAGLKDIPAAAGAAATEQPQVFNGTVGAVAGRDVKKVSMKQGKSRKNE